MCGFVGSSLFDMSHALYDAFIPLRFPSRRVLLVNVIVLATVLGYLSEISLLEKSLTGQF